MKIIESWRVRLVLIVLLLGLHVFLFLASDNRPYSILKRASARELQNFLKANKISWNEASRESGYQDTYFQILVARCDPELLKVVLDSPGADGIEINKISESGYTPLLTAILCNNIHSVKILIEAGADVNARVYPYNPAGSTYQWIAYNKGVVPEIQELLKREELRKQLEEVESRKSNGVQDWSGEESDR